MLKKRQTFLSLPWTDYLFLKQVNQKLGYVIYIHFGNLPLSDVSLYAVLVFYAVCGASMRGALQKLKQNPCCTHEVIANQPNNNINNNLIIRSKCPHICQGCHVNGNLALHFQLRQHLIGGQCSLFCFGRSIKK